MGLLAEGKTRRKINKDPNNTKWTRDETTFGQKILRAQGWQPGEFLGVQNAPHSELHTAANASYIRVVLKDDMKGLGFNRAKEDEVTGLDVFQDLLSRLNGKSEEVIDEERGARMAVKTNYYVEQRYGPMRFVRGGFLVGDEMKELTEEESSSEPESNNGKTGPKESKKEKKSKKRKAADEQDSDQEFESKSKRRRKEERKNKITGDADDSKANKKEKKAKKDKSRSKKDSEKTTDASEDEAAQSDTRTKKRKSKKDKSRSPDDSEEDRVKESKKSRKEKKEKKDKKKRRKEEAENSESAGTPLAATPSLSGTGTSTPTGTGTSTPQGSRNFVRARFIAQKRQAVLDTKALAQIFMVKA